MSAIEDRAALIRALGVACELEHGLALQYLFTAFTLKQSIDEGGLTPEQLNTVLRWKGDLFRIAGQEMQHLVQATNLLLAVGGGAHLRRPNFPQPPFYYPTDLPWGLYRFDEVTLRRYAAFERSADEDPASPCAGMWEPPEMEALHPVLTRPDAVTGTSYPPQPPVWAAEEPADPTQQDRPEPGRRRPHHERPAETIGELYAAIAKVFEMGLPGTLLIGDPDLQIGPEESSFPQIRKIRCRDDALRAIKLLVEQGEGEIPVEAGRVKQPDAPCHAVHQDSHHEVFCRVWRQYRSIRDESAQGDDFQPMRDVAYNPLSRHHSDVWWPRFNPIRDDTTRAVNDLNSRIYAAMILMLYRFFDQAASSENRKRQCAAFVQIMTQCLAPVGELLCTLPMGPDHYRAGLCAGPSYETSRFVQALPAGQPGVTIICEALNGAASDADALAHRGDRYAVLAMVATRLRAIAAQYH